MEFRVSMLSAFVLVVVFFALPKGSKAVDGCAYGYYDAPTCGTSCNCTGNGAIDTLDCIDAQPANDEICNCKPGWSGNNCEIDTDECAAAAENDCKTQNKELCKNNDGGYECECMDGYYYKHLRVCAECESGFYGANCASTCKCNMTNTLSCNHISGSCTCKSGWEGGFCQIDSDECKAIAHDCTYHQEECQNTAGSYTCVCKAGYYYKHPRVCTECVEGKWGDGCTSDCACVDKNTASCDHVTGSCACKAGWDGATCGGDVDECLTQCRGGNETCANAVGSFVCTCNAGFSRNASGVCVDIDECLDASLNNCNHRCHNKVGGYTCGCDLFYNLGEEGQCYASGLVEVIGLAVGIPIAIAIIIAVIVLCVRKNPQCCARNFRDNESVYTQGKRRVWTTHPYFKR